MLHCELIWTCAARGDIYVRQTRTLSPVWLNALSLTFWRSFAFMDSQYAADALTLTRHSAVTTFYPPPTAVLVASCEYPPSSSFNNSESRLSCAFDMYPLLSRHDEHRRWFALYRHRHAPSSTYSTGDGRLFWHRAASLWRYSRLCVSRH